MWFYILMILQAIRVYPMKIGTNKNLNLAYCTNVHPGESWEDIFFNLKTYVPHLKKTLSPNEQFGIGLRLSNISTYDLLKGNTIVEFQSWLHENKLYVFTINGFIYGQFHGKKIKDNVFRPDWSTLERRDYTLRLIEITEKLLVGGKEASISTSPISYKPWLNKTEAEKVCLISAHHMALLIEKMVNIFDNTGKYIHIDIEPEPDCLIEKSLDVITYFEKYLLTHTAGFLTKSMDITKAKAEEFILKHIQLCYDVCHFAVKYEKPINVFKKLNTTGIRIGKIHLSSALRVKIPNDQHGINKLEEQLQKLTKSNYLHQVVQKNGDGTIKNYRDLTQALPYLKNNKSEEWRIHFHVPLFFNNTGMFKSTQSEVIETLNFLKDNLVTPNLEIETYTWDFLPNEIKTDLATSLQNEYQWVIDNF